MGFPGSLDDKEFDCNAGDLGSVSGLGSSPGEGNGDSLQYSCLENSMDRGAIPESDTTERLTFTLHIFTHLIFKTI